MNSSDILCDSEFANSSNFSCVNRTVPSYSIIDIASFMHIFPTIYGILCCVGVLANGFGDLCCGIMQEEDGPLIFTCWIWPSQTCFSCWWCRSTSINWSGTDSGSLATSCVKLWWWWTSVTSLPQWALWQCSALTGESCMHLGSQNNINNAVAYCCVHTVFTALAKYRSESFRLKL